MHFNSQPHEEADDLFTELIKSKVYFNSQPHEEADCIRPSSHLRMLHFNSQPHEEADVASVERFVPPTYFNSQPHEEADDSSDSNSVNIFCISTHSLTKRLTLVVFIDLPPQVFQLTASRRG